MFTVDETPVVRKRILADMDLLGDFFRKVGGERIDAVLLVGSFGRGEGSTRIDGDCVTPLNDYDLVVIDHDSGSRGAIRSGLGTLRYRLGFKHLDCEFFSRESLRDLVPNMFNSDMKNGHYFVLGDYSILTEMPVLDPAQIPQSEARLLLFNRLTCLLECLDPGDLTSSFPLARPEDVTYMASKVTLTTADAYLTMCGRHDVSYRVRLERFLDGFPERETLCELVSQATEHKIRGRPPAGLSAEEFWMATREAYIESIWEHLPAWFGRSFTDWYSFSRWYLSGSFREWLRRHRYRIFWREGYQEIEQVLCRREIEIGELMLLLALDGEGRVSQAPIQWACRNLGRLDLARLPNAPSAPSPGDQWHRMRSHLVDLDYRYLHPTGPAPTER